MQTSAFLIMYPVGIVTVSPRSFPSLLRIHKSVSLVIGLTSASINDSDLRRPRLVDKIGICGGCCSILFGFCIIRVSPYHFKEFCSPSISEAFPLLQRPTSVVRTSFCKYMVCDIAAVIPSSLHSGATRDGLVCRGTECLYRECWLLWLNRA